MSVGPDARWKPSEDGPGQAAGISVFEWALDRIEGRWETADDGSSWELDFELVYKRITR